MQYCMLTLVKKLKKNIEAIKKKKTRKRNDDPSKTDDRTINRHGARIKEINMEGESARGSSRGSLCFLFLLPKRIRKGERLPKY